MFSTLYLLMSCDRMEVAQTGYSAASFRVKGCFAVHVAACTALFLHLLLSAEHVHPNTVVFDEDIGGEAGEFHCDVQVTCGA